VLVRERDRDGAHDLDAQPQAFAHLDQGAGGPGAGAPEAEVVPLDDGRGAVLVAHALDERLGLGPEQFGGGLEEYDFVGARVEEPVAPDPGGLDDPRRPVGAQDRARVRLEGEGDDASLCPRRLACAPDQGLMPEVDTVEVPDRDHGLAGHADECRTPLPSADA